VGAANERHARPGASGAELAAPAREGRSKGSRLLWRVDHWTGHPLTAVSVLAAGLAWVCLSVAFGFPNLWERAFQTLVAAVTVVMVFVIQHTQARHQAATQRKLDEILRVLPDANNAPLALEHASDEELRATRHEPRADPADRPRRARRPGLGGTGRARSAAPAGRSPGGRAPR
jgi:low affinity Fe/Cu permease